MCFAQSRSLYFRLAPCDCAAKPIATIAIRNDAFKNRHLQSSVEALRYPWEITPAPIRLVEVMPRRIVGPAQAAVRLNHVNIYLLADGDGWAMVDAGFGNEESIAAWTALFEGRWLTSTSRG